MTGGTGRYRDYVPPQTAPRTRPPRPPAGGGPRTAPLPVQRPPVPADVPTSAPGARGRHARRDEGPEPSRLPPADPSGPQSEADILSSYIVSHLRTLVPAAWGAGIAWVTTRYLPWLPPGLASNTGVIAFITSGATLAWYSLWRAWEPRLPRGITTVLLGHNAEPRYPD